MSGRSLALLLALVPAFALALAEPKNADPREDNPPVIAHAPIAGEQTAGVAVAVEATVTDESALTVVLRFRAAGAADFESLPMEPRGGDGSYAAAIPAGSVVAPGVEYFIAATDASPLHNAATDPEGAPAAVHAFAVADAPAVAGAPPASPGAGAWAEGGGCGTGAAGAWSLAAVALLALRRASRSRRGAGAPA